MRTHRVFLVLLAVILAVSFGCACRNVGIKVESDKTPEGVIDIPPPPPSYAPGTAHVYAELIDVVEHKNSYEYTVEIVTVYGVGSATPPLSRGKKVKTSVAKSLLKNWNKDPASLSAGHKVKMTIRSLQPRMAGSTGPAWQTVAIDARSK